MTPKIFTALRLMHRCSPSRFSFCRIAPWIFMAAIALMLLASCGDDVSADARTRASRGLAAVMLAVETATDSTGRARAADSAARTAGYDDWADLREHLSDISFFPDDFRPVLDSAQKLLERAAAADTTSHADTLLPADSLTLPDTSTAEIDSAVRSLFKRGDSANPMRRLRRR